MTYTRQLSKTKEKSTSEAAHGGEDIEVFAHVAGVDEGDVAVLRDGVAGVEEAVRQTPGTTTRSTLGSTGMTERKCRTAGGSWR